MPDDEFDTTWTDRTLRRIKSRERKDGRREYSTLTREIELRNLVKILWAFGAAAYHDGSVHPIQRVAMSIAHDAGIDWPPED